MGPQVDPGTVSRPKADAWNKTYNNALAGAVSETRDRFLNWDVTQDAPITNGPGPTLLRPPRLVWRRAEGGAIDFFPMSEVLNLYMLQEYFGASGKSCKLSEAWVPQISTKSMTLDHWGNHRTEDFCSLYQWGEKRWAVWLISQNLTEPHSVATSSHKSTASFPLLWEVCLTNKKIIMQI